MTIAITDANIFIDLIKLDILPYLFNIQLDIHTTSQVVLECNRKQRKQLRAFINDDQLTLTDVPEDEYDQLQQLEGRRGLAEADLTVIYVSTLLKDCLVLTGDKKVRQWCQKNQQPLHGILWLLEAFVLHQHLSFIEAVEVLQRLQKINSRLPVQACKNCKTAWLKDELTLRDSLPLPVNEEE